MTAHAHFESVHAGLHWHRETHLNNKAPSRMLAEAVLQVGHSGCYTGLFRRPWPPSHMLN